MEATETANGAEEPRRRPLDDLREEAGGLLGRFLRPGTADWAAAAHAAPLVGYVLPVPGLAVLVAWLLWRAKRDTEPGVAAHGREALNFQINATAWSLIGLLLFVVPYFLVLGAALVLALAATVRAAQGEGFRYPLIVRVVD